MTSSTTTRTYHDLTMFALPENLPVGLQWRRNNSTGVVGHRQIWDLFIGNMYQYLWIEYHEGRMELQRSFCISTWADPFIGQEWFDTLTDAHNKVVAMLVEHRMRGLTTITIGQFLQIQRTKHPT